MIAQILFTLALGVAVYFFARQIQKVRRNIFLGRPQTIQDQPEKRWKTMARVAMGQSKMGTRPVAAFFHFLIYAGFIIINAEVLEIILDGILGTHRLFQPVLGSLYPLLIGAFEILAVLVILACGVFLARRFVTKTPRLQSRELAGFPTKDATNILIIEWILMSALLLMNASDRQGGPFLVSQFFSPLFSGLSDPSAHAVERVFWWVHILGIFAFLNYLPKSKHFHIILAFPNTWYSKLAVHGKMNHSEAVTREVRLMLDPSAAAEPAENTDMPPKFGAKDVQDLSWKQLLDAYSCTECGRCTSVCPANQTGKLLSPRKIMMDTRDRLEEVGKNIDTHGKEHQDGKSLLGDYITPEELWACTTCNACAEICPINIDPVSIITDLRRELVMEQSAAPASLNSMFTNIENNGAPWQFSAMDRGNWAQEISNPS